MKVLGAFLLLSFGGMVALAVVLVDAIGAVPATLTMLAVGLVLTTATVRIDVTDHIELSWRANATGLILGNRPALLLRTRGNREYVVQCRHPERVADLIHARMGAR
ncbi:hypothetical protein C5D18_00280 [Rathayibacter tritici]|nr:hypothetical protein C5D18_00280 [Rathayibacter tritici]